jgi:replicative DNA helicase
LRDSGTIEEDADVVMLLHREDYYCTHEEAVDRGLNGKAELIVAKQRNGPTGTVPLTWRPEFLSFGDRAPDRYDEFDKFDGGF